MKCFTILLLPVIVAACYGKSEIPVEQHSIARIEAMPAEPAEYELAPWKQIALDFDSYVYDFNAQGEFRPFIWLDNARRNVPVESFGIYTAVGDLRGGAARNNGEAHESINVLGSIYGATVAGIDKSSQNGHDFVSMSRNYFNSATGWNIVMNNVSPAMGALGGGYARDFWYDIYPNMLFWAIGEKYPEAEGYDQIMRTVADQFYLADSVIMATKGDYKMREFDYGRMQVGNTEHMLQADAAAGFAYVLWGAYRKYGDERYLKAATSAMNSLNNETESQFYEVIMPFAAYMAARMNADTGSQFDVAKFLDWTFDGQSTARPGWGVLTGSFDHYAVDGLCGNVKEGYAFAMNTFALAWPLVPMVKYDQSYARAVGRWMVNAVSNSRYFYPQYVEPAHQALIPRQTEVSRGVIAYEGFRIKDRYADPRLTGVEGVAIGDGPAWVKGNPPESMLSIYGSSYVGIFGGIVSPTNVEKILRLNCNVTDYFAGASLPTYLYYNPYHEAKSVSVDLGTNPCDLYDIVSRRYILNGISGEQYIQIAPDQAMVLVHIPAGEKLLRVNGKLMAGDIVIDHLK